MPDMTVWVVLNPGNMNVHGAYYTREKALDAQALIGDGNPYRVVEMVDASSYRSAERNREALQAQKSKLFAAGSLMKEGLVNFCKRLVTSAMERGDTEWAGIIKQAYEETQAEVKQKIGAIDG